MYQVPKKQMSVAQNYLYPDKNK